MAIRERMNKIFSRQNVASKLPYEAIKGIGGVKYQDPLVVGGYHDFTDNFSRKEVILNDSIGGRITIGFLEHIFEKMPKFTENDEVMPEYIMEDVRLAVETLQLKSKFIISGINIIVNGWTLIDWAPITQGPKKNQKGEIIEEKQITGLGCKIFGFEECHPRHWRRFSQPQLVNKISHYRAIYIPRPGGFDAQYHTLSEEHHILNPNSPTFQHLTRLDYNYGLGYSRIQPIWDAITKLREQSDSDHFMGSNFQEIRYPAIWTKGGKAKKFVDKARRATRRRGLAVEAVTNPQTNEDTGLPSVQFRPWGQGTQGQPMDTNRASAYLDGEWLRLLVNLGYSQTWAIGTTAGQTTGSEINLTTDDRADIKEFANLEPVYKKMLKRLAELGVMKSVGVGEESIKRLLAGNYRMECWIAWEYNDKAALQQEQLDHEMEMKRGSEGDKNAYNSKDKNQVMNSISPIAIINTRTNEIILGHRVRKNLDIPMTPLSSGTVSFAGVDDTDLVVRFPNYPPGGGDYKYHFSTNLEALDAYTGIGAGGGSYVWSDLRGTDTGPAYLTGNPTPGGTYASIVPYDITLGAMSQITSTLPGTPGAAAAVQQQPISIPQLQQQQQQPYQTPDDMYNITEITPISEHPPAAESVATPGRVADPSSITGHKKTGPGRKRKPGRKPAGKGGSPIIPYNPTSLYAANETFKTILNSASAMRRFAKTISTDHLPTGWGMKQDTPYKIKELFLSMANFSTRVNRVSIGNSIKAGHPYNYGGEDEFICPRDYKKNIGKKVPLGIYHNLEDRDNISLPKWQVIGTHEVLGWDDLLGQEIAKNEYDIDKIDTFFKTRNERNWIWEDWLINDIEPPISGAYTCNVKNIKGKNWQINIDLQSMSFVPEGNCPWDICSFSPGEENN